MRYLVGAKPITAEMARLWTRLNDGTIEHQQPDGREILASMRRAVMKGGRVEWEETCYCSTPLRHERMTVYDQFFEDMEIRPLNGTVEMRGDRFWDYLQESSKEMTEALPFGVVSTAVRYVPLRIL